MARAAQKKIKNVTRLTINEYINEQLSDENARK
jgi:hypothetical protein